MSDINLWVLENVYIKQIYDDYNVTPDNYVWKIYRDKLHQMGNGNYIVNFSLK